MKTKIKYLLVLVLASFVFAGCCTMHSKTAQWEYKIVSLADSDNAQAKINELGKEGWMLVTVEPVSYQGGEPASVYVSHYIFKRPIH
jgi:hypothetical protein